MARRRWRLQPSHHPQAYSPLSSASPDGDAVRRRAQASASGAELNWQNTVPLRVHLDLANLDEATAAPYVSCFAASSWFKWNFPASAEPPCASPDWRDATAPCGADGGSNSVFCDRSIDASTQNCWGVCTPDDVLTVPMREWMVGEMRAALNESASLLRVRMREENLRFQVSYGAFRRYYSQALGLPDVTACARDAQVMYRIPVRGPTEKRRGPEGVLAAASQSASCVWQVAPSYCSEGVDADVVLFPIMAQAVPGVSGWGTAVAEDQHGRPVMLLMGWQVPPTEEARAQASVAGEGRRIVLHERACTTSISCIVSISARTKCIGEARLPLLDCWVPKTNAAVFHGLGFSIQKLRDVGAEVVHTPTDGTAQQYGLVALQSVTDVDGTTDEVWHMRGRRTLEVARAFFNCSASSFDGLPCDPTPLPHHR
eukprot:SAG11_NODE_3_length_39220_cov_67.005828_30_plen_428_part_00